MVSRFFGQIVVAAAAGLWWWLARRRRTAYEDAWYRAHPPRQEVVPSWEGTPGPKHAAAVWRTLLQDGYFFMVRQTWDDEELVDQVQALADAAGEQVAFNGALHAEHDYFEWRLPAHPNQRYRRRRPRARHR
jgi:hypothetical protein